MNKYRVTFSDDDSGSYEVQRDGKKVGTILFYPDAQRVEEGLRALEHGDAAVMETHDEIRAELKRAHLDLIVERTTSAHWKTAHAEMVARNAILRDLPDLPVDRIRAHDELARLQEQAVAMRAQLERADALAETLREQSRDHEAAAAIAEEMLHQAKRDADAKSIELAMRNGEVTALEEELARSQELAHIRSKEVSALQMRVAAHARRAEHAETEMLSVVGELAAIKFSITAPAVGDGHTDRKASEIMLRTGMHKAGYVLQAPSGGGAAIIHMGAVRWLGDEELYEIVHPEVRDE